MKDESGNEISSFETSKSYGAITISSSKIKGGKSYTLYINGTSKTSLTANNIITSNLSAGGGMNGMGGGMQPSGGRR